jgi:Na+-translocating ferredoxin:NAD+ oxidoreductase subunit G
MKEKIGYVITAGLIAIVASGIWERASLLGASQPPAQTQEETAVSGLLPQASRFEAIQSNGEVLYYKGYDNAGRFIGVVFQAEGKGYAGKIATMAGMTRDGTIAFIRVVRNNETAGVGSRIGEPGFAARFSGKDAGQLSSVQAIAGATISSSAVIDSVAKRAKEITEMLKDEK